MMTVELQRADQKLPVLEEEHSAHAYNKTSRPLIGWTKWDLITVYETENSLARLSFQPHETYHLSFPRVSFYGQPLRVRDDGTESNHDGPLALNRCDKKDLGSSLRVASPAKCIARFARYGEVDEVLPSCENYRD